MLNFYSKQTDICGDGRTANRYAIREGTIVATVLFSPLMKKTINLIEKFKEKQIIHI